MHWYRTYSHQRLQLTKRITKISCIASYVLFRTTTTVKFRNSKICAAIYNSLLYEYRTYSHQRLQTHMSPQYNDKSFFNKNRFEVLKIVPEHTSLNNHTVPFFYFFDALILISSSSIMAFNLHNQLLKPFL